MGHTARDLAERFQFLRLRQTAFGEFLRGDVHDGANDPHAPARFVARNEPPVEHEPDVAIVPAEAVFRRPGLAVAVNRAVKAFQHAVMIIRMQTV